VSDDHVFSTLNSQISDTNRFKDSTPFLIRCRNCQGQVLFARSSFNYISTPELDTRCYCSSDSGLGESEERAFSTLDSQICDADWFKDSTPFLIRRRNHQGQMPFDSIANRDVHWTVCDVWQSDADDGCIWSAMSTMRLSRDSRFRSESFLIINYFSIRMRLCITSSDTTLSYSMLRKLSRRLQAHLILVCDSFLFLIFCKPDVHSPNADEVTAANGPFLRSMTDTIEKYMDQCGGWVDLSSIYGPVRPEMGGFEQYILAVVIPKIAWFKL